MFCQLQCTFYVCKKANVAKLKVEVNVSSVLTVLLQANFNTILSSVVTRTKLVLLLIGISGWNSFFFSQCIYFMDEISLYSVYYSYTMKIFILKAVVLN